MLNKRWSLREGPGLFLTHFRFLVPSRDSHKHIVIVIEVYLHFTFLLLFMLF